MNASKENVQDALNALENLRRDNEVPPDDRDYVFVKEVLEAALRKLPTEAAYARDRQRR